MRLLKTWPGLILVVLASFLGAFAAGYGGSHLYELYQARLAAMARNALPAAYLELDQLPVTVYNDKGQPRTALIGVTLTFSDLENFEAAQLMRDYITDRIIRTVHETAVEDLNSGDDTEILRARLSHDVALVIAPIEFSRLLISKLSVR